MKSDLLVGLVKWPGFRFYRLIRVNLGQLRKILKKIKIFYILYEKIKKQSIWIYVIHIVNNKV